MNNDRTGIPPATATEPGLSPESTPARGEVHTMAPPAPVAPGFEIVDFDSLPTVLCPCGTSQRGLLDVSDYPLSIHRTEIHGNARLHYHRRLTECYYIVSCAANAALELDGQRVPLRPGLCVLIRPGVRHRAIGSMTLLNIVWPKFTDDDEWFD